MLRQRGPRVSQEAGPQAAGFIPAQWACAAAAAAPEDSSLPPTSREK